MTRFAVQDQRIKLSVVMSLYLASVLVSHKFTFGLHPAFFILLSFNNGIAITPGVNQVFVLPALYVLYVEYSVEFTAQSSGLGQWQHNTWSYNQAADDVILLVGLSKVFRHAVHCLLGLPRVGIGVLLLACREHTHIRLHTHTHAHARR